MENEPKKLPTVNNKTAWGKEADMFDICYNMAMKLNASGSNKNSTYREMREFMKEARGHCAELRHINLNNLKLAIELDTRPGLHKYYVNPESKPIEQTSEKAR